MRELRFCEGCGGDGFEVAARYAAADGVDDVEVLVWRCAGCGGETETVEALTVAVEDVVARRRREVA